MHADGTVNEQGLAFYAAFLWVFMTLTAPRNARRARLFIVLLALAAFLVALLAAPSAGPIRFSVQTAGDKEARATISGPAADLPPGPFRGTLARTSLRLSVVPGLSPLARYAWVADALDAVGTENPFVALLPASGDVRRDAARATENGQIWLIIAGGDITAWVPHATGPGPAIFQPIAIEVA